MTVTPTYPGVYIQELPSLVHTITPAPTSIAVFVGYTHPFLTKSFQTEPSEPTPATQLFSFADYQRIFGGFFSSPWLPDYVGQAVSQFFQNGGPTCYVVGIPAQEYLSGGESIGDVVKARVDVQFGADTVTFQALQPVGIPAVAATSSSASGTPAVGTPMQVTFSNAKNSTADVPSPTLSDPFNLADIIVTYGTTVETYRRVQLANLVTALQNSNLVTVTPSTSSLVTYPAGGSFPLAYASTPAEDWTIINKDDFGQVFAENASLDKVPIFNLLVTPGITDLEVTSEAVAYCERKRAFYIMDTPSPSVLTPPLTTPPTVPPPPQADPTWGVDNLVQDAAATLSEDFPLSTNAALYYPWLVTTDPVTGAPSTAPPSGFVAGMYGQEDNARGVWKSPAGIETALLGTAGVDPNGVMTDNQQGVFNTNALDCLRQFPGIGTVIYGARTTAAANPAYQQWKYVAVRRMALFIEQTLYANLTWAVFEGNSTPLWNALTQEVTAFMLSLFRQGAFAGNTPSQSFLVQCDSTTTTPADVANGVVNILVGFAPLVPAEFVIVQIAQLAGQAQS